MLVLLICKPTKKKFKIRKRGNERRKVVRVLSHVGASGMVGRSLGDDNKGDGSRGKRNMQIELRKTFIGRMGFIHE